MKKSIAVFVLLVILLTACGSGNKQSEINNETISNISANSPGDIVQFGRYKGKTIDWIVVLQNEGAFLLVANSVVDNQPFNAEGGSIEEESPLLHANEWSECSLREWLNNDFYNEAFDDSSKEAIIKCDLGTATEAYHKGSESTTDNVFILSCSECEQYLEPIDAIDVGSEYWLRNASGTNGLSALTCDGVLNLSAGQESKQAVETLVGVRPAIWISDKDIEEISLHVGPATHKGNSKLTMDDYDSNNDGVMDDNEIKEYRKDQMDLYGYYSDELRDSVEDDE